MEELVREGPVFDSFSESCNSKEGSLHGSNSLKSQGVLGIHLHACLTQAAVNAAETAAAAPSPGAGLHVRHCSLC